MIRIEKDNLLDITADALLANICIIFEARKADRELYINVEQTLLQLSGKTDLKDRLVNGLIELDKKKYVRIISRTKNLFYVNIEKMVEQKQYYVLLYEDEIKRILMAEFKADKRVGLLQYFTTVAGTFRIKKGDDEKKRGKVSLSCMKYFCEDCNISKRTAIRYNKDLEELGILYIHRSDDFKVNEDGSIRQLTNAYSRPADREICIEEAESFEHTLGAKYKMASKQIANKNRSLAQKSIQMDKGKIYDEETIKEILSYREQHIK